MSLKQDLLDALEALDPQIDQTKASQELDEGAIALSKLLGQPQGLEFVEYIIKELEFGKNPIILSSRFIDKNKLDQLIKYHYANNDVESLNILLSLYHQIWMNKSEQTEAEEVFSVLKTLESSKAVHSKEIIAAFDLDTLHRIEILPADNQANTLRVYRFSLSDGAKRVIKKDNNQYFEIYVKIALQQSGIELIGPINKQGKRAYTNTRYQVDGERIEVDVHGISQPLALFLCEAKTVAKITLNDLRLTENTYNKLTAKINISSGRKFNYQKIFIITGEFDINIPRAMKKDWELLDRSKIPHLVDEFKQIKGGM